MQADPDEKFPDYWSNVKVKNPERLLKYKTICKYGNQVVTPYYVKFAEPVNDEK